MATGAYEGITVHVPDHVAAGLPSTYEFDGIVTGTAGADESDGDSKRPAKTASRGEWAAYVESLGIEPGELTKAELIDAAGE